MAFKRSAVRIRLAPPSINFIKMSNSDFIFLLFSALMHAGWNFYTKKSSANKVALLWFGWLATGVLMMPIAIGSTDLSGFSLEWIPLLFVTACAHAAYLYSLGHCYNIGEISIIYPISRGIGIFITVSIMVIFGLENISSQGILGIGMLITGISLVSIKRFQDLEKRAVMIAASRVGFCVSMYTIIDKISLKQIPALFYIASMFLLTGIILAPIMIKRLNRHALAVLQVHKFYSATIGIVSFVTYYMVLLALDSSPASYVVALREISIVFGSILGMWLLKEERSKRKIVGIVVITIGVFIIKTA